MSDTKTFEKFSKELKALNEEYKGVDSIETIYKLHCKLMKRYGHEPKWLTEPYDEQNHPTQEELRSKMLLDMVHCLDSEVSEFRDALPWKHWKNYKPNDMWFNNDNKLYEGGFELTDMLFFIFEAMILYGFDFTDIKQMYMAK
jgi:hypothetical protein